MRGEEPLSPEAEGTRSEFPREFLRQLVPHPVFEDDEPGRGFVENLRQLLGRTKVPSAFAGVKGEVFAVEVAEIATPVRGHAVPHERHERPKRPFARIASSMKGQAAKAFAKDSRVACEKSTSSASVGARSSSRTEYSSPC